MTVKVYTSQSMAAHGRRRIVCPSGGVIPPVSPTWSPTNKNGSVTLSADKLTATAAGSGDLPGLATLAITAGQKVWIEAVATLLGSHIGFGLATLSGASDPWLGGTTNSTGIYSDNQIWIAGNLSGDASLSFSQGAVLNWAVDRSPGVETIQPYIDGVAHGSPFAHGLTGDIYPAYNVHDANTAITLRQPGSYANAPLAGFTKYGQ